MENEIKAALCSLADAFEQEKEVSYGELVTRLLETKQGAHWWKTAENFWLGFVYPAEQALEVALEKKYPNCTEAALRHIFAIYANYHAMEIHIKNLVERFEGSSGITDKSRRLLKSHLRWLIEGGEIDQLRDYKDVSRRGWDCPQKGTPEQWHEYMLGLTSFFSFGDTVSIIKPYLELANQYLEATEN